jgi:hypothetical protein
MVDRDVVWASGHEDNKSFFSPCKLGWAGPAIAEVNINKGKIGLSRVCAPARHWPPRR